MCGFVSCAPNQLYEKSTMRKTFTKIWVIQLRNRNKQGKVDSRTDQCCCCLLLLARLHDDNMAYNTLMRQTDTIIVVPRCNQEKAEASTINCVTVLVGSLIKRHLVYKMGAETNPKNSILLVVLLICFWFCPLSCPLWSSIYFVDLVQTFTSTKLWNHVQQHCDFREGVVFDHGARVARG